MFTEKVRSGRERTLLQTGSFISPGYYGPQGARRILEFVARRFRDEILTWAVENRLSAKGKMPFLKSVVVAKLVVRPVMEDMAVRGEEAEKIL
ncbi:hypothetical protein MKZ38_003541 [Zalerion maritima]|uniref:Restriction of telomere capping protein 4 n=1 Tax=Zalerion maritima TaxID=339359 RepID=A0AAD5RNC6_9PEZI|nr:hypothetical protein MKZ38_003541 [Zalerion maritima]